MRGTLLVILLLAGSYATLCVLAYMLQERLVFHPSRTQLATPTDVGLAFEDVFLDTSDGVRIHGWYIPYDATARGVFLFFHGNAGNIADRLETLQMLHQLGFAVFAVDYRGYGQSQGKISEEGTYLDAQAAWEHLVQTRHFDAQRIVIHGRSLGAAVAIELASRVQPGALIAESAFTSVRDMGGRVYPWLPTRFIVRIGYDAVPRVADLSTPKLFVHSRDDETVPISMGRSLFEKAPPPKEFLEIRGPHNSAWMIAGDRYTEGLSRFLASAGFGMAGTK